MKRILSIFLALFATLSLVGFLAVITRTGAAWPRSIRAIDWRRLTGTAVEGDAVSVEAPVD